MTLCWSLDKLGPMARYVEDTMFVLQAISGPDPGDPASAPSHLDFDAEAPIAGLRSATSRNGWTSRPRPKSTAAALETLRKLGLKTRR
jgi:Asp-tRNA(Asn)/Glu-tRNA(Gln) amidotransferase A subunit family amidase